MLYLIKKISKQKKHKQKQRGYLLLYSLIPLFLYSFIPLSSSAQALTNNGAQIFSNTNALIFVDGEVLNQSSGTFDNSGTIELTGDWTNNAGNSAFVASNPGLVNLTGAAQNIRGSSVTQFNNLTLSGTGIKTQQIDARVEDTLALNDRELATDSFTMFVLSTNTGAITRDTGFVSSLDTGKLSRNTLSILTYSFPVGSSIGSPKYRPVEIAPNSALAHTFTVRMANVDATSEGFDRSINDSSLCIINPDYYHRIDRTAGSNPADITIYFDNALDNNYTDITHWQNVPRWENTGAVTVVSNGSPVLSSVTKSAWNDYSFTPFALGTAIPLVTLTSNNTTVCPGDSIIFTASTGFSNYDFYNNSGLVQSDTLNTYTTGALITDDTIRVTAFSSGCSAYSNEIIITVSAPPAPNVFSDAVYCDGDIIADLTATGSNIEWFSDAGLTVLIGVGSPFTPPFPGVGINTYYVTQTVGGCQSTADSVVITVISVIVAGPNEDFCVNTTAGYIDTSSATPGGGTWSSPDSAVAANLSPGGFLNHLNIPWGTYTVVYSIATCSDSKQIDITGARIATSDTTICPVNGTFTLPAAKPAGGTWSGEGVDPISGVVDASGFFGEYTYIYTSQGCPDTMRVTICGEYEYFIAEIFSPNNDGINDILYVRGKGIDWILFRIYDRWGEKVFESDNIDRGWDGKFRGKQMNAGVFVYLLEVTFLNGDIYEEYGDITLIR